MTCLPTPMSHLSKLASRTSERSRILAQSPEAVAIDPADAHVSPYRISSFSDFRLNTEEGAPQSAHPELF